MGATANAEEVEALQALTEYSPKLIKALKAVTGELSGERLPDTGEYLKAIINGMNWEIQIYNGTKELFTGIEALDKDKANDAFVAFSDAYKKSDDEMMKNLIMLKIIPFFTALEEAAKNIVSSAS
jgi:hypothetical protein